MRFSAAAPVTWPTHAAWATWWRRGVAELDTVQVRPDGTVEVPDAHPDDPHVRLIAGEHLRPGARYVVDVQETDRLTAAIGIGGTARRRLGHARIRNLLHPGSLTLDLDSLDEPASLALHSDIQYVGADAVLRPDRDTGADGEVRLDWLRLRFRIFVRSTGTSEELVIEGSLTGRGRWRPVLGPVLSTLGPLVSRGAREMIDDLAHSLTELAADPTQGPLDTEGRRRRDVARAAQIMSHRAEVVAASMTHRSWWHRRRPRAWLAALDALPPPIWPPHHVFESWARRERQLLREYVQAHRRELPTWVGQELVRREDAAAEAARKIAAETVAGTESGTVDHVAVAGTDAGSIDELLDLSWLATPRSTLRKITGRDEPAAPS